jgi:hypothetical protein
MEGFKSLPKMQCFKEGGHAKPKAMCWGGKAMKAGGDVDDDLAQDKKLIKKAFKQHDEAEHDKEPTEIKLKKGGRMKKEDAKVRKYKTGGSVENVYGSKKKAGDLDRIEKTKDIEPTKAGASSAAGKGDNSTRKFNMGGSSNPYGGTDAKMGSELSKIDKKKTGGSIQQMGKPSGDKDETVKTKLKPTKAETKSAAVKKMNTGGTCS